jgi:adenosine deaminase
MGQVMLTRLNAPRLKGRARAGPPKGTGVADQGLIEQVRAMPKVELHRHLEGSVRLATLVDVAQEFGIEMPEYTLDTLRPFVQMMPEETRSSQHFLAKFLTIRQFFRSAEVIRRVAREAVEDAAADNIRYLELRFTPPALSNILRCGYADVIGWVSEAVELAARQANIQVRLIVSVNRHEPVAIAEQVLEAALAYQGRGVVALDLAGNERDFPAEPFAPVFQRARAEGLGVTIHAGEWAGAESVREAVERLGAQRIGHGIRSVEDSRLMEWMARHEVVLEVCPTSNVHSGAVADWAAHPLVSLNHGPLPVTINTDDPLVSDISLSDEYHLALTRLGMTLADLKRHLLTAARAAFLPTDERHRLVAAWDHLLA